MSDHGDEVAILPGNDVRGDSSQPQQQEINVDDPPQMSIDELLKVIKGANGMPVLFVPSSDGRLAAVAVDGLQNLLNPNTKDNGSSDEKKEKKLRGWLLLLTSLAATVTFTAGLTPPGGFWPADDKANGYEAGTPIMRDKFTRRYLVFYCSNTTAFFTSLFIIAMLASNNSNTRIMLLKRRIFTFLTFICFYSLGMSYVTGTMASTGPRAYTCAIFLSLFLYTLPHVKPYLPVIVRKKIFLESIP